MRITYTRFAGALLLIGGVTLAACDRDDSRLEHLTVAISKDSVLKVMGQAPKRLDPYLTEGRYIEAMYYPRRGKADPESGKDRNMAPVIVVDGKLVGWGWDFWDSTASRYKIRVAAKE